MADNKNQDPFANPVKSNNWWLYIIGGLVIAGIIIWFFIDWTYKDRNRETETVNQEQLVPQQQPELQETLPAVTVEGEESDAQ